MPVVPPVGMPVVLSVGVSVVGRGLLVLRIDDEHHRAHRLCVRQHLAHRIEHQVLPDPLALAGAVDRETPQPNRRDIGVAGQPLDHLGRKVGEPYRICRERVVALDRVGGPVDAAGPN